MMIYCPERVFRSPLLIFLSILIFNLSQAGLAVTLPENHDGKIEYCDDITFDSADYQRLWDNAMAFLNSLSVPDRLSREVEISEDMTALSSQWGFYLYVKPSLVPQVDGVIIAEISIHLFEEGYQYRIHNFRFIKYARNRFGEFEPVSSKQYPLELYYPDNKKKTWQAHFVTIQGKMTDLQQDLNLHMHNLQKID